MTKEEKNALISDLAERLSKNDVIYLADVSDLDAENSSRLRRLCYTRNVSMQVVKNTLLQKAMERVEGKDFGDIYSVLKGNTSIMIAETGNAPAKLIQEFRKKQDRPLLKGAWIQESVYVGDNQLTALANLKSKDELIGDIILLLQSPAKNVVSGLQSGGNKLAGLIKTLQDRAA